MDYQKQKELLETNKANLEEKLRRVTEKLEEIKNSDIDNKEKRIELQLQEIVRRKYALKRVTDKLEFLRPEIEEDVEYRINQYYNFHKLVRELIPDELNFCFHGSPIFTSRDIIRSGELSSSVDRLGIETSYDVEGQISVTNNKTIDITVQGYSGLNGDNNLPAGCIFVILPKDNKEAETIKFSTIIDNVNFKEEPDRLVGIISTPENIENLTKWCMESGVDTSKIFTFETFLEKFSKQKNEIDSSKTEFLESLKVDVVNNPENISKGNTEPEERDK